MQDHQFPNFDNIPPELWSFLLENKKVSISWPNLAIYLEKIEDADSILTGILQDKDNQAILLSNTIADAVNDETSRKALSRFILMNETLPDPDYCVLIKDLPYRYLNYPENISYAKHVCLTEAKAVRLTEESHTFASDKPELLSLLIQKNVEDYSASPEKFPINDKVRVRLLTSDVDTKTKLTFASELSIETVDTNPNIAQNIAELISETNAPPSQFDPAVLSAAIIHAGDTARSLSLFTRCIPELSKEQISSILSQLQEPFSLLAEYGKRPKLENTKLNLEFIEALKRGDYISSYKESKNSIEVYTYQSADHPDSQE